MTSKIPNKEKPTTDFFLVRNGSTTIQRVKVVDFTPRYVVVRSGIGHRRERRTSIYHAYHETFEKAKYWIQFEIKAAAKKAYDEWRRWSQIEEDLIVLKELDIP